MKNITMCIRAPQILIITAMFLFVICVYIYIKQSCDFATASLSDFATASLMVSPRIQCYLKPGSTKLAKEAYRNQSESSSAYYEG
jgi:hypothetical protein